MDTRFASDTGEALCETIETLDSEPSTEGMMVLAGDGSTLDRERLNPVLRDVSVPVFGGVFPEILHEGNKTDTGAVVAGLTVEPTVTVAPRLSDPETRFAEWLPEAVPEDGTGFVFVDAFAVRAEDFVSSLFRTYGVGLNYVGGGAGSLDMEQQPCLFTNEGVLEDAAVFATVDATTEVGVKHGWQEIAGPFRVTDSAGQVISTLNGKPAFSVYRRVVEADADVTVEEAGFFDVAKSYPFGLNRAEGEKIVRDPFEVGDDGSLTCFGNVPEGEFVHVLKGEPESLIAAAGEAYEEAATGDDADPEVFFFDCISRVLYLEERFADELDAVGGPRSPTVGALTIGEVANDGEGHLDYYNKTAVTAIIRGV